MTSKRTESPAKSNVAKVGGRAACVSGARYQECLDCGKQRDVPIGIGYVG